MPRIDEWLSPVPRKAGRAGRSARNRMFEMALGVLRDVCSRRVAAAFFDEGVFSFQDESSQFHGSGWHTGLSRNRLFQARFFKRFKPVGGVSLRPSAPSGLMENLHGLTQ